MKKLFLLFITFFLIEKLYTAQAQLKQFKNFEVFKSIKFNENLNMLCDGSGNPISIESSLGLLTESQKVILEKRAKDLKLNEELETDPKTFFEALQETLNFYLAARQISMDPEDETQYSIICAIADEPVSDDEEESLLESFFPPATSTSEPPAKRRIVTKKPIPQQLTFKDGTILKNYQVKYIVNEVPHDGAFTLPPDFPQLSLCQVKMVKIKFSPDDYE